LKIDYYKVLIIVMLSIIIYGSFKRDDNNINLSRYEFVSDTYQDGVFDKTTGKFYSSNGITDYIKIGKMRQNFKDQRIKNEIDSILKQ
tara:strand:+ start:1355 stop:1618 length:264 start_codon:yes stop_codon:yes gene_type:complete